MWQVEFFDKILALADYEEGEILCPHYGSKNVEQRWSFYALTSKKERVKPASRSSRMHFDKFAFGSIQIDGSTYEHDVVIDRGEVSKRKKKPSKKFREQFGHTPLSVEEKIPWKCQRLVVGTGAHGGLPVMEEVKQEVQRRKVELLVLPTTEAIQALQQGSKDTNAVLHVTC